MARILAVDDEREQLVIYDAILRDAGHEPMLLTRPENILQVIREKSPDLLISDIMMPGITGGSVYEMVRYHFGAGMPILIVSGTRLRLKSALADPLLAYCAKPISRDDLRGAVSTLLELAQVSRLEKEQSRGAADLDRS